MNERIRELYYECQDESQSTEQCYQNFAELIVKECASLFPMTFTDEQYQRRIDKTILKHFEMQP
jgi:hypothetical protein